MSGLYNVLFGQSEHAPALLLALGIEADAVPRYRDCYINKEKHIVIYTRVGGGNRDDYEEEIKFLRSLPGFLFDEDDSFDNTYALFHYEVPEKYQQVLSVIEPEEDPKDKMQALLQKLRER